MWRDRIRRCRDWAAGKKTLILAFLLALPDILDGLAGVDMSSLMPPGYGAKAAVLLAIARVVVGSTMRRLPAPGPVDRDGGPR